MIATETVPVVAEPIDAERCLLRAGRPVLPGRWVYFGTRESATGSSLAEALFGVEGVRGVLIAHDKVTITRVPPSGRKGLRGGLRRLLGDTGASADAWRTHAKAAADLIRRCLNSGSPAVADRAVESMPSSAELRAKVQAVLDADVNPVVAGHGGGVSIHEVIDNVLYVRMSGGCQGCGLAENTLKYGVEAAIREAVPEIGEIFDLTDHKSGVSPYQGPALRR